jgi:UTP--glucose-1-phosphate uridylyltransferase
MLRVVREILPPHATCIYIRQSEALGLGHAVSCGAPAIGNEDFAVILADDLIAGGNIPCMAQMRQVYEEYGASVIAVQEVAPEEVYKYGIVEVTPLSDRLGEIKRIVEKPSVEEAPSNLAVVGRYILTPRVLEILRDTDTGAGGEIQLTDAIAKVLEEQTVIALRFDGKRYDCGSKLGYLQANVELALAHPELGADFAHYLRELVPTLYPETLERVQES